jgi:hypothetical protein
VKTSTWVILSVVLVASISANLWSKSNRETALVSDTYEPAPGMVDTLIEEKPDAKALNPKYQTLWNDFKKLRTDELMRDHEAMSDPKKNIPVCETDREKVKEGKDKTYLLSIGWICRYQDGEFGFAVEPAFMARRIDLDSNDGTGINTVSFLETKEQIKLYLKLNRNVNLDLKAK